MGKNSRIAAPVSRTAERVKLAPGSLLVLYTDGLIEATRDVMSGAEKLRARRRPSCPKGNQVDKPNPGRYIDVGIF
jgi:hypothetical protein